MKERKINMRKTTEQEKKNYKCADCADAKNNGGFCKHSTCPYAEYFKKEKK